MGIMSFLFGTNKEPAQKVDLSEYMEYLNSVRTPALILDGSETRTVSRLGGAPNLPENIKWPQGKKNPLSFLCQLDLTEIPDNFSSPLPEKGGLFFFYDADEQPWGFKPNDKNGWRVIYTAEKISQVPERKTPEELTEDIVFSAKDIAFKETLSFPLYADMDIEFNELELDEYYELRESIFETETKHILLGHPFPMQSEEMEEECQEMFLKVNSETKFSSKDEYKKALQAGTEDWIQLFQLDTDDDIDMMWGDAGMLYFWIRKQDLAAGNFDNVWMILQCG